MGPRKSGTAAPTSTRVVRARSQSRARFFSRPRKPRQGGQAIVWPLLYYTVLYCIVLCCTIADSSPHLGGCGGSLFAAPRGKVTCARCTTRGSPCTWGLQDVEPEGTGE